MSLRETLLLTVIVLLAGLGGAVFMHPRGADGVRDMLGFGATAEAATASSDASDPIISKRQRMATQLQWGDQAYDSGDFSGALTFYSIASIAQDASQRSAAQRGIQRSVLAWGIVEDCPTPDYGGRTSDERFGELLGRAETERAEQAWLNVVLFAKGAGMAKKLPGVVDTLFEVCQTGGPVEERLQSVLRTGTSNFKMLAAAMSAIGLDHGATGGTVIAGLQHEDDGDNEPSGIGFTNDAPVTYRIPFGNFPKAFRAKLEDAAKAEYEGIRHAEAAGPDGTDRTMHRREALRLLRIARDVYNEALEIDPDAVDVQKHLKEVTLVFSQVRKSATFAD
jgi:hypothetical protein